MKKLTNNPELTIDSGHDGVWLHFKTKSGKSASVNLHVFCNGGSIIDNAITEWAKDYARENPPKHYLPNEKAAP
jgi:hypothetical protein